MEGKNQENKNSINQDSENKNEEKKLAYNKKPKYKIKVDDVREESETYYITQRSYSCKVGEAKSKNFSYNNEEIKFDLNKKFKYLKTPKLKPKKGKLIPNPLNIGSISRSTKKSKSKFIDEENIIFSEGEQENSKEGISDSDSELNIEKENLNIDNIIKEKIENKENNNYISNENFKINEVREFEIEEENDDDNFNEKGNLVLKKLRKNMILSKINVIKNSKNYNELENIMKEKYDKIKENILNYTEREETKKKLFKTIGFPKEDKNLPILDFLRKNSASISEKYKI